MQQKSELPYVNVPETIGNAPSKKEVEQWLRLLAGYIIQNTSYQFFNSKNGKSITHPGENDQVENLKLKSMFNDWKYWNGVIHMAFHELATTLGDSQYNDYVKQNYDYFFNNLPVFKKMFDQRVAGAPGHQYFRMDRLDDFGAMASGLFELNSMNADDRYSEYLEKCIGYIRSTQDRLSDGTFCRRRFEYTSLWGDDLYMSVPFLVRAWKYSSDESLLQDAVDQVFHFHKYLFRKEMGLYYHYRIMEENVPGVAHWGRANGWMVMAQCQLLDILPENHPKRSELINLLKEHLTGLARYQTGNGMWRQLLDKCDSFLESSCTAMFTYGFAKAINKGWISDIYSSIPIAGWNSLKAYCTGATGYFDKVSTGFNFKQDLTYYYNVPIEPGGDHGIGAALYAGIEICKMKDEFRDCVWC